jgi:hypothetical protein
MHTLSSANNIIPNRLIKAVLPSLTSLLSSESDVKGQDDTGTGRKKGKKRARNYEGDEVFKVAREVICPRDEDGDIVLAAVDGLRCDSVLIFLWAYKEHSHSNTPTGSRNNASCSFAHIENPIISTPFTSSNFTLCVV